MNTRWFTDSYAQQQHALIAEHIKPLIQQLRGPGYELSHLGINKNDMSARCTLRRDSGSPRRVELSGAVPVQEPTRP